VIAGSRRIIPLLCLLLLSPHASAQSQPQPLPERSVVECEKASAITFGVAAPCSGVLLPSQWAREAVNCKTVLVPSLRNDLRLLRESTRVELDELQERYTAIDLLSQEQRKLLDEVNAGPTFWESPVLWGIVGGLVGVGLTVGIVYALR